MRNSKQKLKLLYLIQIFDEYTDEEAIKVSKKEISKDETVEKTRRTRRKTVRTKETSIAGDTIKESTEYEKDGSERSKESTDNAKERIEDARERTEYTERENQDFRYEREESEGGTENMPVIRVSKMGKCIQKLREERRWSL